jgi:tRNA dimethylallyltransferase
MASSRIALIESSPSAEHVAIVGATASGKSALALELARRHPGVELISVDSMQVYRGMDIGTAKPSPGEQAEVPHHLIDLADPDEEFTVTRFQAAFADALAGIEERGHRAVLVGGTALYLQAVVDGLTIPGRYEAARAEVEAEPDTAALHQRLDTLDPIAAARMEPSNRRRIVRALEVTIGSGRPFSSFGPGLAAHPPTPFTLIGIALPAEVVAERIAARYAAQLANGFVDEVRALAARANGMSRTSRQALGYRELLRHVEDGEPIERCIDDAIGRTRRFARRQRAWFRRDPRIEWLHEEVEPMRAMASLEAIFTRHT